MKNIMSIAIAFAMSCLSIGIFAESQIGYQLDNPDAATCEVALSEISEDMFDKLSDDLIELYVLGRMKGTSGPGLYFDYRLYPFVNFDEYINGYTLTNYAYLAKGISYDRSYDFYVKDFTGIKYYTNLQHLYLVMEQEKTWILKV